MEKKPAKKPFAGMAAAIIFSAVSIFIWPLYFTVAGFLAFVFIAFLVVRYGAVPATLALIIIGAGLYAQRGIEAPLFLALLTVPFLIGNHIITTKKYDFIQGVTLLFALTLPSFLGALVVANFITGDVAGAIVDYLLGSAAAAVGGKQQYVDLMISVGYLKEGVSFDDLHFATTQVMREGLPAMVITYIMNISVFSVLIPRTVVRSKISGQQGLPVVSVALWRMPKKYSTPAACLALGLYIGQMIVTEGYIARVFATLFQIIYLLFVYQGIAATTFFLKTMRKGNRTCVIINTLLFLVFKTFLFVMGVFDVISPFRRIPVIKGGDEDEKKEDDTQI